MLDKIYNNMKKDIVLTISCILAVLSCIISPISVQYIDYIDIHTLILLFCLMLIVEGLRQLQFFSYIANILLLKVHTQRGLSICLVSLCFISSMFITNDVALITFIPFGIMILELVQMKQKLSFIIMLMTIAANLGSMFTPIGNPQNMYLYSIPSMHITSFLFMMLPYILIAAILLLGCIIFKINWVIDKLGWDGFALLLAGGIIYTIGAVLYGVGKRKKYMHSVFHLCIFAGSLLHFLCILLYVV